jgi:hypothetical protein
MTPTIEASGRPAVGGGMMVRLNSSSARAVEAVSGLDDKAGQEEEERGRKARGQRDQQKVKDVIGHTLFSIAQPIT